jgi:hypothetical protein
MRNTVLNVIIYLLAFIIGAVVAFEVFAAAFLLPTGQFLTSAFFVFSLALLASALFGFFQSKRWLSLAIVLALPTVLIAIYFGLSVALEGKSALGYIPLALASLLFPIAGAWLGQILKHRQRV